MQTFRISTKTSERLREHCKANGIKLAWFVERAILEKLERTTQMFHVERPKENKSKQETTIVYDEGK